MSKIIIQDLLKSSLKVKTKKKKKEGVLIKIRKFPIENKLSVY